MSESGGGDSSHACPCTEDSDSSEQLLSPNCICPEDDHGIVIHEESCLLFKNETFIYDAAGECECCLCPLDKCRCNKSGRAALDDWRAKSSLKAMPAVLEASHPLMKKFQETLQRFLEKENAIAADEILNLKEELRQSKLNYSQDLETIYRHDHDTNAQRALIEEYEANVAKTTADREAAELRARDAQDKYKQVQESLNEDLNTEREATEELEALTALCRQLEQWREETESDLTVSHRVSDKMRAEKRALADEKRQLDLIIYGLGNEVFRLESKLEMFQKQLEIKNNEMDLVNDKVTSYAAELEDLELDKRRLVSLWNSVLVNIKQRDNVYNSVREDYRDLVESYRTLMNNLEITKKVVMEEMNKSKEIAMNRDKLQYDIDHVNKQYETEDTKRLSLETQITELVESIEMTERDQEMIKMENQGMSNFLRSTEKDFDRKVDLKMKLENEILDNLQERLLNDKAVESMANGIKKMRELARKQEISLMAIENQHAKVMLDIEVYRAREARNKQLLEETVSKVREREKELDCLQEKYDQKCLVQMRKQRELDIVLKKYAALKETFDLKSPQERRIDELEQQIKSLRERTTSMQDEWLRLQGHVVKLTAQHHKLVADSNLINKQIQICEQKSMRIQAEYENVVQERGKVERELKDLRGRLEVMERTRKEATENKDSSHRANLAITYEYAANLKDAETEIIQFEEEIDNMDKEKVTLTQHLDRVQREALIWQRKGILAVELKRNITNAKSAVGEIGQMRTEIHRMEVRREQLRRTAEKLADDLALCITRRETAMDKSRAEAAVEKAHGAHGHTSQSTYHHKLRLARADVGRVSKDIAEAKAQMERLQKEQEVLERQMMETSESNAQLEEHIATLMRECREADKQKHWILERVVRSQHLGKELSTVIKRQSLKVRKNKNTVLQEYEQALALNSAIRQIVDTLADDYPYLNDQFDVMRNTLNIHSPTGSPRLCEEGGSCVESIEEEGSENIAEKPLCP